MLHLRKPHIFASLLKGAHGISAKKVFFEKYLRSVDPGSLRARFANQLETEMGCHPRFCELVRRGGDGDDQPRYGMMTDIQFYESSDVFDIMSIQSVNSARVNEDMYVDFVSFALRLNDYDKLAIRVRRALDNVANDHHRCDTLEMFLKHIMDSDERFDKDFFFQNGPKATITIEDLVACATHASDASKLLSTSGGKAKQQMSSHFLHVLDEREPQTWEHAMKDAGTIAFFIKYLDREDLNLAQEKFRQALSRLPDETRSSITELFEEAASEYNTPLVDLEQLDLGRDDSHDGIIDDVIAKKDDPKLSKDMQLVAEITGRWMRFMKESGNPPMTPHHVQIYCVLMLVNSTSGAAVVLTRRRHGG